MSLSLALAFIQSMSPENKKPLLNQSGPRVRYENSDIFYVDDGASYTSRNIGLRVEGMRKYEPTRVAAPGALVQGSASSNFSEAAPNLDTL
jgi:hypothetical protein